MTVSLTTRAPIEKLPKDLLCNVANYLRVSELLDLATSFNPKDSNRILRMLLADRTYLKSYDVNLLKRLKPTPLLEKNRLDTILGYWVPCLKNLSLFRYKEVADVSALSSLKALQILGLSDTPVADVGPLSSLKALRILYLFDTPVADVGPLSSLKALQKLYLYRTQVADVGPLSSLKALQILELSHTPVADVGPLSSLKALQILDLTHTQVADVGPLSSLKALQIKR